MASSISPPLQSVSEKSIRHLSYQELDILHSLRGFCAFYVVIFHAKYILWSGGRQYLDTFPRNTWSIGQYIAFALDMLSSAGYEMVIFFFVLSGFFIRYAQLKKHRSALPFYVNRIVRIYPPFLTSVLLGAVLLTVVALKVPQALTTTNGRELNQSLLQAWHELTTLNFIGVLRTVSFLQIKKLFIGYNDVYWSLLPEALFYLCVPLAFWKTRLYYGFSIVAFIVGIIISRFHLDLDPFTAYLLGYNLYFAVGAMLYDIVTQTTWLNWIRRISGWLLFIVVAGLFAVLLLLAVLQLKMVSGLVATILAILTISLLLAGRVKRENAVVRVMHKVGVFSFSLYLYHFPLLLLCYGLFVATTGELFTYSRYYWLAVPMITLVCYGLYWVTERASVKYFRKV